MHFSPKYAQIFTKTTLVSKRKIVTKTLPYPSAFTTKILSKGRPMSFFIHIHLCQSKTINLRFFNTIKNDLKNKHDKWENLSLKQRF